MVIKIQNVCNFSFSGTKTSNGTIDTVIECSILGGSGMVIINSSSITIENLIIRMNCITRLSALPIQPFWNRSANQHVKKDSFTSLVLQDSYSVNVQQLTILTINTISIVLDNVLSNSCLKGVSSNSILVMYSGYDLRHAATQNSSNKLIIVGYHSGSFETEYKLDIILFDHSYHIEISILQVDFQYNKAISITTYTCSGLNEVKILNCSFINIKTYSLGSAILVKSGYDSCKNMYKNGNVVNISGCRFTNNTNFDLFENYRYMIKAEAQNIMDTYFIFIAMDIINCEFSNNKGFSIFASGLQKLHNSERSFTFMLLTITNTTFMQINSIGAYMFRSHCTSITFKGPLLFNTIEAYGVIKVDYPMLSFKNYVEFSNVTMKRVIKTTVIFVYPQTTINITLSLIIDSLLATNHVGDRKTLHPPCVLQYITKHKFPDEIDIISTIIISITKYELASLCNEKYCATHCSWYGKTLFQALTPLDVNRRIIQFDNEIDSNLISDEKDICYCTRDHHKN